MGFAKVEREVDMATQENDDSEMGNCLKDMYPEQGVVATSIDHEDMVSALNFDHMCGAALIGLRNLVAD